VDYLGTTFAALSDPTRRAMVERLSPYEPPRAPELRLDTVALSPEECADRIVRALEQDMKLAVQMEQS